MKIIKLNDRLDHEMEYVKDHKYFRFLYNLWNCCGIIAGDTYSVNIPPEYNDTDYPDIIKIVSFYRKFNEINDASLHFVVEVSKNTFKEFVIEILHHDYNGQNFYGPFDVFPTNIVVYKRKIKE